MLELAMVSGPLPLSIWRSSLLTGDGFLVADLEKASCGLVPSRERVLACVASSTAFVTHVGFCATRTATAIWIFKGFLPRMLLTRFYLLEHQNK